MTDIMEARRKGFDEWYAKSRGTLGCGTYKDDLELWNAALDSVCVELSSQSLLMRSEVIDAIERVGMKVKP